MLNESEIDAIRRGLCGDPFALLGAHGDAEGRAWVRTFQPGATQVWALGEVPGKVGKTGKIGKAKAVKAAMELRHADGVFEVRLPKGAQWLGQYAVEWAEGVIDTVDDPYRFPPVLGEMDTWLLAEGRHLRPYEMLGAHRREMAGADGKGVDGVSFAVWAPNASRVSVVGDFNLWDGRRHPMRLRSGCGVWELFIPALTLGARYKFELLDREGHLLPQKADPFARQAELRPATASIVAPMPAPVAASALRQHSNALDAPMSIYEVHLGSWRRRPEEGNRWLSWDELADELVAYAVDMGFTHLELMPISEHPFDGSWGYQSLGAYAPTARFGDADGFGRFVARAQAAGVGVLLDWVPAHFPSDAHGLAHFDGTHLYEYADPREGFHQDWNTLIYNFGRTEVSNFLVGNALYWLERYGVDGLRVDAVASMLYRDYSRKAGEWIPNVHGGRENLEAIDFLRRMNEVVGVERPQAITLAEESTAFPQVSRPTYTGGLGFHYKWNMGWMHDTLTYMARDPLHRRWHHGEMTFGMVYAYDENFVLPLSHDEVVHGKGSLLTRMPGDRWQKFANLRAYFGFMFGHPGKKLLFMGAEFAQEREWNHEHSLDWHLLGDPLHAGVQRLLRDLNGLLRTSPALYQRDYAPEGFAWVDHADAERSLLSFVRTDAQAHTAMLVVSHFTPEVRTGVRLGVPHAGTWRERLNTDSAYYGGSNVGTPLGAAVTEPVPSHGHAQSIVLTIPPLATMMLEWTP